MQVLAGESVQRCINYGEVQRLKTAFAVGLRVTKLPNFKKYWKLISCIPVQHFANNSYCIQKAYVTQIDHLFSEQ